jgi:hypothetical protein
MLGLALLSGRRLLLSSSKEVVTSVYFNIFDEPSPDFSINANRGHELPGLLRTKANVKGTGSMLGQPVEVHVDHLRPLLEPNCSIRVVQHSCGCSFTMVLTEAKYADRWEALLGARLRADEIEVRYAVPYGHTRMHGHTQAYTSIHKHTHSTDTDEIVPANTHSLPPLAGAAADVAVPKPKTGDAGERREGTVL